jgi:hypothetical protein
MSAVEIISEIKKLPQDPRRKVFRFVDAEQQKEEDRRDNAVADRALAEPGANIPWAEARKDLGWSRARKPQRSTTDIASLRTDRLHRCIRMSFGPKLHV